MRRATDDAFGGDGASGGDGAATESCADAVLRVRPAVVGPIDLAGMFGWWRARAVPGLEVVGECSYARMVRTAAGPAGLEIIDEDGPVIAAYAPDSARRLEALSLARRLLDLDADSSVVDAALGIDPILASTVSAAPGVRVPGAAGLTEILVRAILGQQVTVAAARLQLARLVVELGEPAPEGIVPTSLRRTDPSPRVPTGSDPARGIVFPSAAAIAQQAERLVRGPRSRTETLIRVCAAIDEGSLTIADNPTAGELVDRLTALRGIGPWTADYVAMRLLGAPDILVRKDVALLRGARNLGLADSFRELSTRAERFSPWRSYLGMHLWRAAS